MTEKRYDHVEDMLHFIDESPTAYQAVANMKKTLEAAGYTALSENDDWQLTPGGRYFVTRNGSSLLAFRLPAGTLKAFRIAAAHSDSPLFKIKAEPEVADSCYVRLNVEKYGGMLCAPWFDRPLSCAGRLIVKTEEGLRTVLVDAKEPLFVIPNLAIHMNREANDGYKINVQKDMLPLYGDASAKGSFLKKMAFLAGVSAEAVIGQDLYLYPCEKGIRWGAEGAFISSGRLDDLECVYASLTAFLASDPAEAPDNGLVPIHAIFDNEEVGSSTREGAGATFLADTLVRIAEAMGVSAAGYRRLVAASFMLSADNAHAVHPAAPEKSDPVNRPVMNGGVVIKYNANHRYTTDGVSAAIFKMLCDTCDVPYQTFANRSDMAGGSTLGSIASTRVPVRSVDIGLAQLAMHSPYETAGAADLESLIRAEKAFFETPFEETEDGCVVMSEA